MRYLLVILLLMTLSVQSVYAQDDTVPTRYGAGLLVGSSYDPGSIGLVLVQGQIVLDYDRVFWHAAPEPLRFKLEVNGGLTTDGNHRGLLSLNMLALYYLDILRVGSWLPYVEAGIGAIYTDFKVAGQGSRINFNPQLGIGAEYPLSTGAAVSLGLRLHHLSNGDLLEDNRGVNSILLQLGYLF